MERDRNFMGALARLAAILALSLGIAGAFAAPAAPSKAPTQWVQDELLVGVRAGAVPSRTEGLLRAFGITVLQDLGPIRIYRVRVPAPVLDLVAYLLLRSPEVKSVEKNYLFDPAYVPNDPQYADQWHLAKILAPQAWDLLLASPGGATIAIVDSGIDPYHPDLSGKLVAGTNTYDGSANSADTYGHGTEVAGVAGAASDNAQGIASIAGRSPLMPVRVTDGAGRATSASIAAGIVWAADHGASVVNVSFNGIAGNATIRTAAEYAFNRGVLVVGAAGNCGCADPTADNPYILSVSATDEADGLAYFSSTGPSVDIAAPGTNILTTAMGGLYLADSGTSLASPLVAGVAAGMFTVNGSLTPSSAAQLLAATAVDLGTPGYDTLFGAGRVDAHAAIAAASTYVPPPDTAPPSATISAPAPNATVSGAVVVSVAATDNVGVARVDLYLDGAFLASDASSPFSFLWDTVATSNGPHALTAVAVDAAGNSGSSAATTVTVANTPPDTTAPTVSIGSPAAGATVSGTATVTANAADDVGVTKVDFYVDGVLRATDTAAPYSMAWDTTALADGTHALQARATDAAGNSALSATVSVTVSNVPPDTTAPVVSFTAPAAGATVSGTVAVSVAATDNVGVTGVELRVDGVLLGTDPSAPYGFSWNAAAAGNGAHTLTATATDAAGNRGSASVTVTVANPNQAPLAVNDAYGAPYRSGNAYTAQVFPVLANDSDPDGSLVASSVRIRSSPNKGGAASVNANGTVSYSPRKGYHGTETFTYTVKDNLGATSNTATVTVTIP